MPVPAPAPVPPLPFPPTELGPLDAINQLLALPWKNYIPPFVATRIDALKSDLEGKVLAQASHNIDSNTGWDFALTLKNVSVPFDLTNPPGFTEILPVGKDGGFTLAAPLTGSWSIGFAGTLELSSKIQAAGVDLWNAGAAVFPWSLTVSIQIQAAVKVDGSTPDWPTFSGVTVKPTLELHASEPIPCEVGTAFQVSVKPGFMEFKAALTDVTVGIGNDVKAGLDVNFVIDVTPSPTFDFLGIKIPTADFKFALNGNLKFSLPDVGHGIDTSSLSAPFSIPLETILPIPEFLNQYLLLSKQQLPMQVGLGNPLGAVQAAPSNYDFGTPAAAIEAALIATHLPYNALFTIEHERAGTLPLWSALHHCSDEEDSAIWTGHLLSATSFQYAATNDSAALQLVNQLLDGVDQLFNVCTDAVVKNGVRSAVPSSGFFARSFLPDDSPARWWQADDSIANNNRAFYEQPEGGWDIFVDGQTTRHFNTYADLQASLDPIKIPTKKPLAKTAIRPVGRVWCGVGAGGSFLDASTDHQLSRDQIIGVCFGLFTAWFLVSDQTVKSRAAARLTELIAYIIQNGWNVPLPPDTTAVCTSYLGAFDHQLALLRIGATVNPTVFGAQYDSVKAASEYIWVSIWTTVLDPLFQYYKMNLSHAAIVPLLMAEQDPTLRRNYLTGYNILRQATSHHRNAWFNVASILVQLPADRAAYMSAAKSGSNPALSLPAEIQGILVEWLNRRNLVAEPNGLPTNAVPNPQSIVDLWNKTPDQVQLYQSVDGSSFYISKYARSVDQRAGGIMEFTWQNDPFSLGISGKPSGSLTLADASSSDEPFRECTGMDYLLPYWISLYVGVFAPEKVPTIPSGVAPVTSA